MKTKDLNIAMVVDDPFGWDGKPFDWNEVQKIVKRETKRCKENLIVLFNGKPILGGYQLKEPDEIVNVRKALIGHGAAYAFVTVVFEEHLHGLLIGPDCNVKEPYKKGTKHFPKTADGKNQFRLCIDIREKPLNKKVKNFFDSAECLYHDPSASYFNQRLLGERQRVFINDSFYGIVVYDSMRNTGWIIAEKFGPLEENVSEEVRNNLKGICCDGINVYTTGLDYKLKNEPKKTYATLP